MDMKSVGLATNDQSQVVDAPQINRQSYGGKTSSATDGTQSTDSTNKQESDKLQKLVEKINTGLTNQGTRIEHAKDEPPNHLWFNLVDTTTGQVIEKFPPEGLRQFTKEHDLKGLYVDKNL